MPLYTLYPCREDGSSETFVTFVLESDAEADMHALHVLDQHPSCANVVVWAGERKVLTRTRVCPALRVVSQRREE